MLKYKDKRGIEEMDGLKRLTPANLRLEERLRQSYSTNLKQEVSEQAERRVFTYTQNTPQPRNKSVSHRFGLPKLRQVSPLLFVIAVVFGVITFFSAVASPLTMLARLATDNLNTQDLAVDTRTNHLLNYKLKSDPNKPSKYQIVADYRQISPELAENLKKEQIIFDQNKAQATFQGKIIYADQFLNTLNSDINLAKSASDATMVRRGIFQDRTWQIYKHQAELTQSGLQVDSQKKTLPEQEMELTKAKNDKFRFNTSSNQTKPNDDSAINQFNEIIKNLDELNKTADELQKDKHTPNGKKYRNLIFVDKPTDTCSLYQTAKATQNYQKTAQADQLSKLASLLLTEADKIKAGVADSEVVTYLNERLTSSESYTDSNGQVKHKKSALDSYAQRRLSDSVMLCKV